jgi:hypothetical protein
VNPRLGFGPSVGASATIQGTPFRHGKLAKLALLGAAGATRSAYAGATGDTTRFSVVTGNLDLRYPLSVWLGVMAGYQFRYSKLEGANSPGFLQNVFFVGLSGYWTTDKSLPVLESLTAPVNPG